MRSYHHAMTALNLGGLIVVVALLTGKGIDRECWRQVRAVKSDVALVRAQMNIVLPPVYQLSPCTSCHS